MRADFLDRFSRMTSPIHRLHSGLKLAIALCMVIAIVLMPPRFWWFFIAVAGLLILIAALSRLPISFLVWRIILLEPFIIGVGILMLLQPDGLRLFLVFLGKSTLCLLTMILLAGTTPFSQILSVLRRVGVPALLITTLALMYRYLFVLVDELERMRRARRSRTFISGRHRTWSGLGVTIGQLFVRASERAERIYAAMCARGWR